MSSGTAPLTSNKIKGKIKCNHATPRDSSFPFPIPRAKDREASPRRGHDGGAADPAPSCRPGPRLARRRSEPRGGEPDEKASPGLPNPPRRRHSPPWRRFLAAAAARGSEAATARLETRMAQRRPGPSRLRKACREGGGAGAGTARGCRSNQESEAVIGSLSRKGHGHEVMGGSRNASESGSARGWDAGRGDGPHGGRALRRFGLRRPPYSGSLARSRFSRQFKCAEWRLGDPGA